MSNTEVRSRKFSLVSYLPRDIIEGVLAHRPVRTAVYILHDRDLWTAEDEKKDSEHVAGTLKDPHFHILLCTRNASTLGQVRRWFKYVDSDQNTLGQVLDDDEGALRYLTHKDDPDKAQYADEEVIEYGEGKDPFLRASSSSGRDCEMVEHLIDDINNGEPLRLMARYYGKDFVKNYARYREYAELVRRQENPEVYNRANRQWTQICTLWKEGVILDVDFYRYGDQFGLAKEQIDEYIQQNRWIY